MSQAAALEHLREGRPREAAAILEKHLAAHAADAQGWFLLGACHHALYDLGAAARAFSRSLLQDPSNLEAHLAYVTVQRAAGDRHGALAAARAALARVQAQPRVLYAIALCLEDLGLADEALAQYDAVLAMAPEFEDALHNRGLLLARLGRFDDALDNGRQYLQFHPGAARAHAALADVHHAEGRFDEALRSLAAAERLAPSDSSVRLRKGVALASQRDFAAAAALFHQARTEDPRGVEAYLQRLAPGSLPEFMLSPENLFFWQCQLAFRRCDWTSWQACVEEMRALPSKPSVQVEPAVAFMALHLPLTEGERRDVARQVAVQMEAQAPILPPVSRKRTGRIRVGILSPDLREHVMAYLLLPLFELLDRTRFEAYAYALLPGGESEIAARVRARADQFRDLSALPDQAAAQQIREDDIDILIDVAGHTTGGRFGITAQRPARLQALYLGFAGSLGSTRVDFAIADRVSAPEREVWTETLELLPHTYHLYDFRQPPPAASVSRADYGLPAEAFVYCAFHKAEKISPDSFALWMRTLKQVPRSVLWLGPLATSAQRNLLREAARLGVEQDRLRFAPFEPATDPRYLARHALGDLFLDALHHNAIASCCDALAAALPVLTLQGSAMASRSAASLLHAAGLPELIADDPGDYVTQAALLAEPGSQLPAYRRALSARTAPLFDTVSRVREIEAALARAWQRLLPRP